MGIIEAIKSRLQLMIGRCVLAATNDKTSIQELQIEAIAGEVMEKVQRFQNYGLASNVPKGAKGISVSVGSNREDTVVLVLDHPDFRVKNLEDGEVVLFDKLGQKIFFKANGTIEVRANEALKVFTKEINAQVERIIATLSESLAISTPTASIETETLAITNETAELVSTLGALAETLESTQVLTLIGLQPLIPGGEPFTTLKEKIKSFEGGE